MVKGPRVLVPLDGSELSAWTLGRAGGLLAAPGARVTLLHAVEAAELAADPAYRLEPLRTPRGAALAAERDRLRARGVDARAELRFGDAHEAILRELGEGGYDWAALTTHGRTGLSRVLLGSVAQAVLRRSPLPLLLFRPLQRPDGTLSPVETREPAAFRRALVLLDGSSRAEEILGPATSLAQLFGGEIRLFSAVPGGPERDLHLRAAEERLDVWRVRLAASGVKASTEVRTGAAAPEALAAAREWKADLLALTTHGRTGLARALYGSVAERILAEAPVPLLVSTSRTAAGAVNPERGGGPVVHVP